eukprot:Nitzschia sp. Nitz4//scaffold125_size66327//10367//11317//NITZ4_006124-RA/size66327-processed-gene-0.42-mRNA-1//-1//CDS//3329534592//291//frame0
MADETDKTSSGPAIRMVIQRYRQAKLLINESEVVTVGHAAPIDSTENPPQAAGLLAYVSFAATATPTKVEQAAKTLLNLPVLTLGAWGDGSVAKSLLQLSSERLSDLGESGTVSLSLVLVPQANLTAKVKRLGKSIQYRDQISKSEGEALYDMFVGNVRTILDDHLAVCHGDKAPHQTTSKGNNQANSVPDSSIPPNDLFHPPHSLLYGSYDEDNLFPITLASGEPLTKSAAKKLKKIYEAHVKRHSKFLEKGGVANSSLPNASNELKKDEPVALTVPVESKYCSLVEVVSGSFGKRQGLELQSDMGPFCHVVELE